MEDISLAREVLKSQFGYADFRRGQGEAISSLLNGRDILCVMPTGAGKSICYQIPALLLSGVALVISPLISLMKDQVDQLVQNGVPSAAINSGMSWDEVKPTFFRARAGEIKLLYVAPERLESSGFREFLRDVELSMVIVDEAHCVSQWGHDFRPSYLNIAPAIASLSDRPVVGAFTATATPEVRVDIAKQLCLKDPEITVNGFDRENLFFQVERPEDKTGFVVSYVKKFADMPGIVYCSTRKAVDALCRKLQERGIKAVRYHAGLSDEERRESQDSFIYDRASVIVATNAFGMGIDKSNVRYVLHNNMPSSIDSYYQEAGRAGRDGAPADCLMLFSRADISTARFLISQGEDETSVKEGLRKLRLMTDYANTSDCLRAFILRYFGEKRDGTCGNCGSCVSSVERADVTIDAQKIISCVYRAAQKSEGRSFGTRTISDVLRGVMSTEVEAYELDKTSTWGIMAGSSADDIMDLTEFIIARGLLQTEDLRSLRLSFTGDTMRFLRSGTRLMMHRGGTSIVAEDDANKRKNTPVDSSPLLDSLKVLRREVAQREKVPPYVIFTDKTLIAICEKRPKNEAEMLDVPGIGQTKLQRYGAEFLALVREWNDD